MHDTLGKEQIYVAVDLLILTEHAARLKLLLSRRPQEPFSGRWALPGRFVGMDESAETSAQLLLMEMLGTQKLYMEQLYTFTDIHRDPRGRVISIAYLVVVPWKEMDPLIREHAEKPDPAVAFSTTNYHVFRAGLIARKQGERLEGIGSPTKRYFWINAFVREFIATLVSERKRHLAIVLILTTMILLMVLLRYYSVVL